MLIRSIGLFWKRENVYWNSAPRNGRLLGVAKREKASGEINFRDQLGVYVLYAEYDLVYVGMTGTDEYSLYKRLKAHTRNDLSDRWDRFSWFGVRRVTKAGSLAERPQKVRPSYMQAIEHMEAILIHAAEPPLNRQGGRFGESVIRYLQVRDTEKLGPTPEEMLKDIWDSED